ncbi:unnamed protein product [Linum trigynum]|uniref:Uncharacterized protein n=1 Tax=Linum trigynum TaxID=586398 RepID=A0AAV2GLI4_9ROSI
MNELQNHGPKPQEAAPVVEGVVNQVGQPAAVDSSSEEDNLQFDIKSRKQPVVPPQKILPGQVRQVVAAFEASMTINDDKDMAQEAEGIMISKLNEYGSNFENETRNLDNDTRKRAFDELEGGIGTSPTPKKQFVEEQDTTEPVEVASRDWPQSDK